MEECRGRESIATITTQNGKLTFANDSRPLARRFDVAGEFFAGPAGRVANKSALLREAFRMETIDCLAVGTTLVGSSHANYSPNCLNTWGAGE